MTMSEAIAKMIAHFSKPGAVFGCETQYHTCVYRGDNDPTSTMRCSVGVLIQDNEYSEHHEGQSVLYLVGRFGSHIKIPTLMSLDADKLAAIQRVHDDMAIHSEDNVSEFVDWLKTHEDYDPSIAA